MPPSPRLSARSTSTTYLRVTTNIRAQNRVDTAPVTASAVSGTPLAGENTSAMV
jgi:hypothetical protein